MPTFLKGKHHGMGNENPRQKDINLPKWRYVCRRVLHWTPTMAIISYKLVKFFRSGNQRPERKKPRRCPENKRIYSLIAFLWQSWPTNFVGLFILYTSLLNPFPKFFFIKDGKFCIFFYSMNTNPYRGKSDLDGSKKIL